MRYWAVGNDKEGSMATRKTKTENKRIARAAMKAAQGGAAPAPAVKKAKPAAAKA